MLSRCAGLSAIAGLSCLFIGLSRLEYRYRNILFNYLHTGQSCHIMFVLALIRFSSSFLADRRPTNGHGNATVCVRLSSVTFHRPPKSKPLQN